MKNAIAPRRKPKTPEKVIAEAKKLWLQGVPATEISRQLPVQVNANTIRRWAKQYDWRQSTEDELAQERLDKARIANGEWLDIETKVAGIMRNYASKLTDSIQESDGAEYTKLSDTMEHVFKLSKLTQEVGAAHERLLQRASEAADPQNALEDGLGNTLKITDEALEQLTKAILVAEFSGTRSGRVSEAEPAMLAVGKPSEEQPESETIEDADSQLDDENG